ncbi:MAG: GIY-YIG nuclease family protein [Bacteroidetes bacterium]|nr:GIY-YIG nuclease family protein [Bacteroidota bacterium]
MSKKMFSLDFDGYWRVRANNIAGIPSKSSVYCVYECTHNVSANTVTLHQLIYIGESQDVSVRVSSHEKWSDWSTYVGFGNELCFSFAYEDSFNRSRVEAALIYEHKPPENTEFKSFFPFDATTIKTAGQNGFLRHYFKVYNSVLEMGS